MTTTADAATQLRSRIDALGDCRGPWYVINREQNPYPQSIGNIGVPYDVATTTTDPTGPPDIADYIAMMNPRVGRAVADLIECPCEEHAEAASRVLLGIARHA